MIQSLASEHQIESKLYSGDGLERLYQLIGDNQVTIWLSNLCEETYDDHEQWMKLIEFLEKDLKVQQQRMLIQEKFDEKRNAKQNLDGRQIGKSDANFTNQSAEKKCYFFMKLMIILQQLVQEEQKLFSISPARSLLK